MNQVRALYNDFIAGDESYSPEYILRFFESNAVIFNNIHAGKFEDKIELGFYVELVAEYIRALYEKGRFNEAVDASIFHLEIIESESRTLGLDPGKHPMYVGSLFFLASSYNSLRAYRKAWSTFKLLSSLDPANENFRICLSASRYAMKQWASRIAMIGCVLVPLVSMALEGNTLPKGSVDGIIIWSYVVLLAVLAFDHYARRSFRKKRTSWSSWRKVGKP